MYFLEIVEKNAKTYLDHEKNIMDIRTVKGKEFSEEEQKRYEEIKELWEKAKTKMLQVSETVRTNIPKSCAELLVNYKDAHGPDKAKALFEHRKGLIEEDKTTSAILEKMIEIAKKNMDTIILIDQNRKPLSKEQAEKLLAGAGPLPGTTAKISQEIEQLPDEPLKELLRKAVQRLEREQKAFEELIKALNNYGEPGREEEVIRHIDAAIEEAEQVPFKQLKDDLEEIKEELQQEKKPETEEERQAKEEALKEMSSKSQSGVIQS